MLVERDRSLFRELAEGMKRKPPEQEQTELVRKKNGRNGIPTVFAA
jgi:hypothetical protein